jgi:hypothetical protein
VPSRRGFAGIACCAAPGPHFRAPHAAHASGSARGTQLPSMRGGRRRVYHLLLKARRAAAHTPPHTQRDYTSTHTARRSVPAPSSAAAAAPTPLNTWPFRCTPTQGPNLPNTTAPPCTRNPCHQPPRGSRLLPLRWSDGHRARLSALIPRALALCATPSWCAAPGSSRPAGPRSHLLETPPWFFPYSRMYVRAGPAPAPVACCSAPALAPALLAYPLSPPPPARARVARRAGAVGTLPFYAACKSHVL